MVRATIASAKAQQQMNVYGHGGGQTEMHNNHHHKRSLVMYVATLLRSLEIVKR